MTAKPVFLSDKFTPARLPEVCAPRKSLLTRFDEAKFVYMATDGWAIGVKAIALSGKVAGGGGDDFAHFFENLAWNAWDGELRDFCMRTSIADEFDTELAAALSGRSDAHEVMEDLSKSNSFLSRLHGDTYRYHQSVPGVFTETACGVGCGYGFAV